MNDTTTARSVEDIIAARNKAFHERQTLVNQINRNGGERSAVDRETIARLDDEIVNGGLELDAANARAMQTVVTNSREELREAARSSAVEPAVEEPARNEFLDVVRAFSEGRPATASVDIGAAILERQLVAAGVSANDIRDVAAAGRVFTQAPDGKVVSRALSIGTENKGGYFVPTMTATMLIDYMEALPGVANAGAMILTTTDGSPIEVPTDTQHNTDLGETAEAATVPVTEDTFGQVAFSAYKYVGSSVVSRELLEDSGIMVQPLVMRMLARVLNRKSETRFTLGTGANQPQGIMHAPPAGRTVTLASQTALTVKELRRTLFTLDAGYLSDRSGLAWMQNPLVYATVLDLEDNDGRPLFLPSQWQGEPDRIWGVPVRYNVFQENAVAAGKYVAVVGNFNQGYWIRSVRTIDFALSEHSEFKNSTS